MAGMNTAYLNEIADHGAGIISEIGLVDDEGNEITGGSYARQTATWNSATDGDIYLSEDLTFEVPGGTTVGGWRAYSDTDVEYGGKDLTNETFSNDGRYTLIASETAIQHNPY